MQFYPRFLSKELIDEYRRDLAPEKELFTEFKAKERATKDHNGAFDDVGYEKRFELTPAGHEELARLTALSRERDVFLICQCQALQKCHADLLLLIAKTLYDARIPLLRMSYPTFNDKLTSLDSGCIK